MINWDKESCRDNKVRRKIKIFKLLVINPGSTSTKVAAFNGSKEIFLENIKHESSEFKNCRNFYEEFPVRKKKILEFLDKNKINLSDFSAIIARGAPLKPLKGGTYRINNKMLEDIKEGKIQSPHASVLGAVLAHELSNKGNLPSFIADPVSVDEFHPLARFSGLKEIKRKSLWHALNSRAVAKAASKKLGRKYENLNLVVAHLGGGITVSAHRKGKAIDVNNANSEGPFSPERCGTLPVVEFARLCYSGKYSEEEMIKKITKKSGLLSYLGTNDAKLVEEKIKKGNKEYLLVYKAMAYQISKEIGAYSAVLKGKVDAVILTGGLANSKKLIRWIKQRISFIAPVLVYPGEDEMRALAEAALRVLSGKEKEKVYR